MTVLDLASLDEGEWDCAVIFSGMEFIPHPDTLLFVLLL